MRSSARRGANRGRRSPRGAAPARRGRLKRLIDYATHDIWMADTVGVGRLRAMGLAASRVLVLTIRGFHQHRVMVQGAALTYYTVLSIVPVLAVSFALARGMGFYDRFKGQVLEPFLDARFGTAPESTGADESLAGGSLRQALDLVLSKVDEAQGLAIGVFGFAILMYTAIKLLSAVERSLNEIWGLRRGRSWTRRFTDYIAIVVVTPVLLLLGTAAVTYLRTQTLLLKPLWGDGGVDVSVPIRVLLQGAPLASFWLGLTFAYVALPNTRVRLRSALIGALAAALLWLVSQHLYVGLQVGIARYNEIYAGMASLPIFLFWVFFSWVIFLIGAELTYAHQSVPVYTSIARMGKVDHAFRESLALRLCGRITHAFLEGRGPTPATLLASQLEVAPRAVNEVLEVLEERGLLAATTHGSEELYLPARDPETITVFDVLEALKVEGDSQSIQPLGHMDERIDRILVGLAAEARNSLHNYTLRELALTAARETEGLPAPPAPLTVEAPEGPPA